MTDKTPPETPFASFHDASAVAQYAEGPPRQVPGHDGLLVMTDLLLAEHLPVDGQLLVVGAGGGLELSQFANNHPDWRFVGVDPSAAMLDLAARTMGMAAPRATLLCGTVDSAPEGPFDGATCLLTLHFVALADKLPTLRAIRARLKTGAPFVCAHYSVPGSGDARALWFTRNAAFAERMGMDGEKARAGALRIASELPILTPDQDEALLKQAGFAKVSQFYASFAFRGWICEAA
jgi:tRNA (cmo5U34)-methyltransferase